MNIFCDFDGTITTIDVVDAFLNQFAKREYLEIEEEWINNTIGSKECLIRQFQLVEEISDDDLKNFIDTIEVDTHFLEFYEFIQNNNWNLYIISDGLDLFIKKVLEKYNIVPQFIYANVVAHSSKLTMEFPYFYSECFGKSGNCKCSVIKTFPEHNKIYIGDGKSDFCPTQTLNFDFIFAKNKLYDYLKNEKEIVRFETFKDITKYLQKQGF